MKTNLKISIAMATYNGERFLEEQLDSISSQKHLPLELVVCDDGSTDKTMEILESFAAHSPFHVQIYRNSKNLGYARNFFKAARLCKGDWISFCDQDDVWLPNKLDDVRVALQSDSRPVMILQNAYICDADLNHTDRLFPNLFRTGFHHPRSQFGFWVWPGFVKTIKKSILQFLIENELPQSFFPGDPEMTHDKWTCMIANATGGVRVIGGPSALYRRHENALTGDYGNQTFRDRIQKTINVGSPHYKYLADVACETAVHLQAIAAIANIDTAEDFTIAANHFFQIEKIHRARARLYETASLSQKFKELFGILILKGYFGYSMTSLGWKSFAKDLTRVFRITRHQPVSS